MLTQLLVTSNQPVTIRAKIEKEIKYLTPYEGKPGTLVSFSASVNKIFESYTRAKEQQQLYEVIFNTKIAGTAKNYLLTDVPSTWTECIDKLRKHFRPAKDDLTITRQIGLLRVRSIRELDNKIKTIVEDITEYAAFSDNSRNITNSLLCVLAMKIKEMVSGALAYALSEKLELNEIRNIINKFIGQDQGNLKSLNNFVRNDNYYQRHTYNNNIHNNYNPSDNNNRSGQYRNYTTSGQTKNTSNNSNNNTNNNNYSNRYSNNNNSDQTRMSSRNNYSNRNAEPMDTFSASYQRQINNIQAQDFPKKSLADFPI
ncbi:uncharacterized protein DDB_G0289917-like [Eupeodes corollae]|uniref:uncharacterized protein DDB_G0289917-like n=1 Tax=Eupeodes corollae TaxID=290404 RepID=UPI0024938D02|nr:uncharacterized protein DDB_G0289917-like [Eupeodes corollae]